ncbi:MAG: PAS domain S-box protein, partial [Gammaproteobacteria bacterium]
MHVQRTPLGVVEWSPDFEVIEWNKSAEDIFGFTKEEVLGKRPFGFLLPKEEEQNIHTIWEHLLSEKGGERSVNSNLTKSGSIKPCSWYNTALKDSNGKLIGIASLVLDITDQVNAEQKNKQLQQQLFQAQKMEAIGNLAGGIAHDFNNLLQSISGYTQLLLIECEKRGENCDNLKGIENVSRRAALLVKKILTFSRNIEST